MNMKQMAYVTAFVALCSSSGIADASDNDGLRDELRKVVEQNIDAFNQEDITGAMSGVHTKSPEYGTTREALPGQFEELDARTELVGFSYIGHDDEFAVARVKLKTTEVSGQPFTANVIDTLTVFHQENGVWKYWSDHILGVELAE